MARPILPCMKLGRWTMYKFIALFKENTNSAFPQVEPDETIDARAEIIEADMWEHALQKAINSARSGREELVQLSIIS